MLASSASIPNKQFDGIVQIIGSRVNPETRTLPVHCLITEAAGLLKPDMFANVQIFVGETRESLTVPSSALINEDGHQHVFVRSGQEFIKREVEVNQIVDDLAVIESGLEEGEQIAVEGAFIISSESQKSDLKGHDH